VTATLVHLVRHGESTWNAERRLQGQTGHPPLTALGLQQAREAAVRLRELVAGDPVAVWSSDLVRARQTADEVGTALGTAVRTDPALREQALGTLEGRLPSELAAEPPPPGMELGEVRWGGGESVRDVHARVGAFFDRVLRTAPRHLVVVSHGDAIRVARAWLHGLSHREVDWTDALANGGVLTVTPAHRTARRNHRRAVTLRAQYGEDRLR
jgi:probable phosphoglycerate mutase